MAKLQIMAKSVGYKIQVEGKPKGKSVVGFFNTEVGKMFVYDKYCWQSTIQIFVYHS